MPTHCGCIYYVHIPLSLFNFLDDDDSEADLGYSGPGYLGTTHSLYDTERNDTAGVVYHHFFIKIRKLVTIV